MFSMCIKFGVLELKKHAVIELYCVVVVFWLYVVFLPRSLDNNI